MEKKWLRESNRMLLLVSAIVLFMAVTYIIGSPWMSRMVEPMLLLPFLYFFTERYFKINFMLAGFLFFASIAHLSRIYNVNLFGFEIDILAYCLGYLFLIYEAIAKIRRFNMGVLISVYLIVVFVVNGYFLYSLYDAILKDAISNSVELALVSVRAVSLLLFALFSFMVYLSSESKLSILLLLTSISLVFSDVLFLVSKYYMYFWLFDFLAKALYLTTLYCIFLYALNNNKINYKSVKEKVLA